MAENLIFVPILASFAQIGPPPALYFFCVSFISTRS